MSVHRFEEIRRYLHFIDNLSIPKDNTDRLIKIRPFLTKLHETFHDAATPEESQSIDEMMIPFKGRSGLKQYIKSKPKKWGFKMWVRAGVSGYVYCFEPYQASSGGRGEPSRFGVAGDVVLRLCHDLSGKNHKVYCDNLFTSVPLAMELKRQDIYIIGTCRSNRLQGAEEKLTSDKEMKKSKRGTMCIATSADNISVTKWNDNNIVRVVSSFAGMEPKDIVKRYSKTHKSYLDIERPYSILLYNKHMGGVDLMDFLVALYSHNIKNSDGICEYFSTC